MLAILVGLWNFRLDINKGDDILLRTDNKTVESVLKSKNSADLHLAEAIRWICMFAFEREIRFYVLYINTKVNKMPDALSRFDIVKAIQLIKESKGAKAMRKEVVKFPEINVW